jgi:2-(1,2-epoxy-1,2-dihydrophenyl)acetyl-CoA isomerase
MSDSLVLLDVADGVATLTLNRTDARNALDLPLAEAVRDAAAQIEARDDVRVVVYTHTGPMFSPGGDLAWMDAQDTDPETALQTLADALHEGMLTLRRIDAPVIAAVKGVAAGAGMSLVAAADLAIAGESAKFTMAYTAAGLSPDGGSTWFLPRMIGLRRTAELALTNRRLDAREAAEIGLITRAVPDDEVDAQVAQLAAQLAAGPTRAYGRVKRLLEGAMDTTLEEQMRREGEWLARSSAEPDGREGAAAFLAKRKPAFTGRA